MEFQAELGGAQGAIYKDAIKYILFYSKGEETDDIKGKYHHAQWRHSVNES